MSFGNMTGDVREEQVLLQRQQATPSGIVIQKFSKIERVVIGNQSEKNHQTGRIAVPG